MQVRYVGLVNLIALGYLPLYGPQGQAEAPSGRTG